MVAILLSPSNSEEEKYDHTEVTYRSMGAWRSNTAVYRQLIAVSKRSNEMW